MRSAFRLVVIAVSVFVLAFPALPAVAEQQPPTAPPTAPATGATQPGSTAPAGPKLEPADTEEERAESRRKIVMGVSSAVLLGIVVWGRTVRRKKKAG